MYKQILKFTFITFIWKRYKQHIASTIVLLAFIWLVSKVHSDYLNYSELRLNTQVGWSFIAKWVSLVAGLAIYIFYHLWRQPTEVKKTTKKQQPLKEDPFATLRTKEKLRSKADFILEKNK